MVRVHYPGVIDPPARFEALRPCVQELLAMRARHRPGSQDRTVIEAAIGALDTAAYHFTRRPDFYGLRAGGVGLPLVQPG